MSTVPEITSTEIKFIDSQTKSPLASLPPELILKIFDGLELVHKACLGATCPLVNQAYHDPRVMTNTLCTKYKIQQNALADLTHEDLKVLIQIKRVTDRLVVFLTMNQPKERLIWAVCSLFADAYLRESMLPTVRCIDFTLFTQITTHHFPTFWTLYHIATDSRCKTNFLQHGSAPLFANDSNVLPFERKAVLLSDQEMKNILSQVRDPEENESLFVHPYQLQIIFQILELFPSATKA